uniref:Whey acidic protein n=1 Tax=Ornithorhynchus anatinus TaxID=9258 RepID=A0A6I8NMJ1_ORNAN
MSVSLTLDCELFCGQGMSLFIAGCIVLSQCLVQCSKAGTCPVSVPEDVDQKDCKQLCDKDSICPEKTKCCMVGCSRQCVAPVPEKAGECPKPLTWVAQPCTEKSECADDLECGDDSKCCFNGCAKKCIPPYKANPGRCPAPKACLVQIPKLNKCLDDFPCRDGQKCCNVGCHLECVEPLPEEATP